MDKILTSRDREILVLIAQGSSNKEVAAVLKITSQTVKNHMTNIFFRLSAVDRTHAVVLAHCTGQLHLDCK